MKIELFLSILINGAARSRSFRRASEMLVQLLFQGTDLLFVLQKLVPKTKLCVTDGQKWALELELRADSRSEWWGREAGGSRVYGIDPLLHVTGITVAITMTANGYRSNKNMLFEETYLNLNKYSAWSAVCSLKTKSFFS